MKIAVIGLGYVGLPLASLLARNFEVVGFDVDAARIETIRRGEIPITEPELDPLLSQSLSSGKLVVSTDCIDIGTADVKIITVGTPYDETKDFVDYSQLEMAIHTIIPQIRIGDVIILKSTVPPGTTMGFVKKIIEDSGFRVPQEVGLVFSPERMIEGQAIRDFLSLPKIIGASDQRSALITEKILKTLGGKIIIVSNPETAETIKMVDNYSRYVFLGLTNELAIACEKIGVDVIEVIRSAKDDYPRNAGLLIPGPGVGGSCLNKDPFILRGILRKSGMELNMVRSAQEINAGMPFHVVDLVKRYRSGGKVTILGVSFKGDTDDTRFTPSFTIRDELKRRGFEVIMTDPFVKGSSILSDFYEASRGSNILIVLTDHSQYKSIDLHKMKRLVGENPLIIDGKSLIDRKVAKNLGFEYHGIGRL
ncbi:MAG: nucleotide sugar dehydrogenase [Thermoplasmatales archaeon]